ncbi:LacI family DNA-binding transcriptional regulator [Bauldia sp.]|uniref:LacI family DNA-binding transcriptional regulator n=1 Tax=Bauldia sp. TaxID=2575872 RepID=UPI003BAA0E30
MATIRDVARHAGVSIATVSAALNESGPVSADARRRVWEAVEAVGYAPNAHARSLRLGKSRLIGAVVGDVTNPFWGAMVRTIEAVAEKAQYSVIIRNTDELAERELDIIEQLRAQRVAGIILNAAGSDDAYLRRLQRSDLPAVVTIDQWHPDLGRDFVGVDNRAAGRMLAEYVIRLGHRRVAVISGRKGMWTADERMKGAVDAMRDAGIAVDPTLYIQTDYRSDASYAAATPLLTRRDRPTAIIGCNNDITFGALRATLDLGFRCPEDISIAGIDEVPWSGLVRPRVTVVVQPVEDMSRQATTWLLERITANDTDQPPPRQRVFAPSIVLGDSCAPLSATVAPT